MKTFILFLLTALALSFAAGPRASAQGGPIVYYGPKSQFLTPAGVCFLASDGSTTIVVTSTTGLPTAASNALYLSATGAITLPALVLDSVTIGTAGSANALLAVKDGTNTVATLSCAAPASIPIRLLLASGTLSVVLTGGTAPDVTIGYR
jgi:hypothetical protein